jgi:SAM-dependent methyltransferase
MTIRRAVLGLTFIAALATAQISGKAAYNAFTAWRTAARLADWDAAINGYRAKLKSEGLAEASIERALRGVYAYGEAELYDTIYTGVATFNSQPNQLLVDAVRGRRPGAALDIAMGQGRNSLYLAAQGWKVTGFDVSFVGVQTALRGATERGLKIAAVHASDDDFDFGEARWDLIANLYAMEKRSVQRIRRALKPGGLAVVEAGHKSASGAAFEYESKELLEIFQGFRILHYEEPVQVSDWGHGTPIRLVRLIAEKPR